MKPALADQPGRSFTQPGAQLIIPKLTLALASVNSVGVVVTCK